MQRLKAWSGTLEKELVVLVYAYRDPRTPWYARAFCAFLVAITISPIDLIPDFIPILGYLDDALFLPIGIWLAIRMIPAEVMADSRNKARDIRPEDLAKNRKAALVVIVFWLVIIAMIGWLLYTVFNRPPLLQ